MLPPWVAEQEASEEVAEESEQVVDSGREV
jgi:hypothetical protein